MQVSVTGLEALVRKLEAYRTSLESKQRRFLENLAQVGIDVASVRFSTAQYDGENNVEVSPVPEWADENTLYVVATGTTVMFIEFGTGIHYTEQHPTAAEFGFVRGTYGQQKGSRDRWEYYGVAGTNGKIVGGGIKGDLVATHGNPPARAMYDAAKQMRSQIAEMAREVFNSDRY